MILLILIIRLCCVMTLGQYCCQQGAICENIRVANSIKIISACIDSCPLCFSCIFICSSLKLKFKFQILKLKLRVSSLWNQSVSFKHEIYILSFKYVFYIHTSKYIRYFLQQLIYGILISIRKIGLHYKIIYFKLSCCSSITI